MGEGWINPLSISAPERIGPKPKKGENGWSTAALSSGDIEEDLAPNSIRSESPPVPTAIFSLGISVINLPKFLTPWIAWSKKPGSSSGSG